MTELPSEIIEAVRQYYLTREACRETGVKWDKGAQLEKVSDACRPREDTGWSWIASAGRFWFTHNATGYACYTDAADQPVINEQSTDIRGEAAVLSQLQGQQI